MIGTQTRESWIGTIAVSNEVPHYKLKRKLCLKFDLSVFYKVISIIS
jgi:hypothetical protein